MKIIFSFLLTMSIAGTISFAIYLLSVKLFDHYFSAVFRYSCLKLCLMFYLCPFALIRYYIFRKYFTEYEKYTEGFFIKFQDSVIQNQKGFMIHDFTGYSRLLTGLWIIMLTALILLILVRSLWYQSKISRYSQVDLRHVDEIRNLKKSMKIRRKIALYRNTSFASSFTYGNLQPSIVISSTENETEEKLILMHEMQHIKSFDFAFKLMIMFAVIVHCFNPFIYFFEREFWEVQELACDEKVTERLTKDEKRQYGYLLIRTASKETDTVKTQEALLFSRDNKKLLKRRVMRIGKKNKISPVIMTFTLILMALFSCVPAFAYSPKTADVRNYSGVSDNEWDCDWIADCSDEPEILSPDETTFKVTDYYIILDNGTIIIEDEEIQPHAVCKHTYISGKAKKHTKKGNGCIVTIYNVKRCSKCGNVVQGSLVSKTEYTKCPHK